MIRLWSQQPDISLSNPTPGSPSALPHSGHTEQLAKSLLGLFSQCDKLILIFQRSVPAVPIRGCPCPLAQFSSVAQSCLIFLRPHELQHARLPCPTLTPRVYSNSCPLSWRCHPTISSSVIPFSSRLQSFPASGSFPMSQSSCYPYTLLSLPLYDTPCSCYATSIYLFTQYLS